jgi:hypothetical protein
VRGNRKNWSLTRASNFHLPESLCYPKDLPFLCPALSCCSPLRLTIGCLSQSYVGSSSDLSKPWHPAHDKQDNCSHCSSSRCRLPSLPARFLVSLWSADTRISCQNQSEWPSLLRLLSYYFVDRGHVRNPEPILSVPFLPDTLP